VLLNGSYRVSMEPKFMVSNFHKLYVDEVIEEITCNVYQ